MSKKIHWIPASGPITVEHVTLAIVPTLEAMQKYVEGNIEVVNVLFNQKPQQMIVNDEGLIHELPLNITATSIYHAAPIVQRGAIPNTPIAGNAILLEDVKLD